MYEELVKIGAKISRKREAMKALKEFVKSKAKIISNLINLLEEIFGRVEDVEVYLFAHPTETDDGGEAVGDRIAVLHYHRLERKIKADFHVLLHEILHLVVSQTRYSEKLNEINQKYMARVDELVIDSITNYLLFKLGLREEYGPSTYLPGADRKKARKLGKKVYKIVRRWNKTEGTLMDYLLEELGL